MAMYPDLAALASTALHRSPVDHRAYVADAATRARPVGTVRFRKSITQSVAARTSDLPPPDPSIHKGNSVRTLLALIEPGQLLDPGAGRENVSLSAAELGWQVAAVDSRTGHSPEPARKPDPAMVGRVRIIRWAQADVREFPTGAPEYALICVHGLLHHLDVAVLAKPW